VGDGCSHCAQIKKFLTVVDLSTGLNVEIKEVYHDAGNAQYFTEIADSLQIPSMERGVPMLYVDKKAYFGVEQIKNYLLGYETKESLEMRTRKEKKSSKSISIPIVI